ncbi:hypothetical protein [Dongia sp.]|uniref:hypothetical protein n=1 Tax=Dongia sp. TaxID=1977262 RepID=UPI0035AD9D61
MTTLGYCRAWCLIAMVCSACASTSPTSSPGDDLSPIEKEAYIVFMDQIKTLHRDKNDMPLILCTSIQSENKPLPVSAALLDSLSKAVAGVAKLTFVDGANCHENNMGETLTSDGSRAITFFGERDEDAQTREVTWFAGSVWGLLAGGGAFYKITMKDDIPTLETTGLWNI